MSSRILGLDPGLSGALAVIDAETGDVVAVHMIPINSGKRREIDAAGLAQLVRDAGDVRLAVVERVASMPRQGVASTFAFGKAYGTALGILGTLGIPVELVSPQRWKATILDGTARDKAAAVAYCRRRWPGQSLLANPRCRTAHDGHAESLCLAEFGRRIHMRK